MSAGLVQWISHMQKNDIINFLRDTVHLDIDGYTNNKTHCTITCRVCGGVSSGTAAFYLSRYKKTGKTGCTKCGRVSNQRKIERNNRLFELRETFEFPENVESLNNKDKLTVKNKHCGHSFETTLDTIIHGGVQCPVCEQQRRSTMTFKRRDGSIVKKQAMDEKKFLSMLDERNETPGVGMVFLASGERYRGMLSRTRFACAEGHTWETVPGNVIHLNSGCPYCSKKNYSKAAINWIECMAKDAGTTILHAENGGEQRIAGLSGKMYSVDGYDPSNRVVYEYNGSYYHGDLTKFFPIDTPHPFKKSLTALDLYNSTLEKQRDLEAAGYTVISHWDGGGRVEPRPDFDLSPYGFITKKTETGTAQVNIDKKLVVCLHPLSASTQSIVGKYALREISERYPGFRVLHFFDDEIDTRHSVCMSKVLNILGCTANKKIAARKCTIVNVTGKQAAEFLNLNHIQGADKSSVRYGLEHDGELVAVMTFCKPRVFMLTSFPKVGEWELSRYATDISKIVQGGASRLLNHFVQNNNPSKVFSYADLRWSEGDMYKKMGFHLIGNPSPSYHYVIGNRRFHRYGFRKSMLARKLERFDPSKSEWENMRMNGIDRVWDLGSLKFEKEYNVQHTS